MTDDDWSETIECPYCHEAVYEDAERCPHCENYLSREDTTTTHPTWIYVGAFLCLLVALFWIVGVL